MGVFNKYIQSRKSIKMLLPPPMISLQSISSIQKTPSNIQNVPKLYSKFLNVSSQIELDREPSNLNLVEYEMETQAVFDEGLKFVKLQHIENQSQLRRADMELQVRTRRMNRIKQAHNRKLPSPITFNFFGPQKVSQGKFKSHMQSSSGNMFRTFQDNHLLEKQKVEKKESQQDFLEPQNQQFLEENNNKSGILFYDELKKHPKILNYTLQRARHRDSLKNERMTAKTLQVHKYADQIRSYCSTIVRNSTAKREQNTKKIDPLQIVQNRMRKIYTRNIKKRQFSSKSDLGMERFNQRQKEILEKNGEKRICKENYQKLKDQLQCITYEISQCRRRNKSALGMTFKCTI